MANDDRKPYLSATTLDQDFLDAAAANLVNQLEMTCDIEVPTSFVSSGFLRLSDRHKYRGSTFYEARMSFPVIKRTIGEWLVSEIEFSVLDLEVNNVDGFFEDLMPAGDDFESWINKSVTVALGLRDVDSTYTDLFTGKVTEIGGFRRGVSSFAIRARDDFDEVNKDFPPTVMTSTAFPDIDSNTSGLALPVIYGDWTVSPLHPDPNESTVETAAVPAFVVNGADADMNGDSARTNNIQLVICDHDLVSFDDSNVYLFRGDAIYLIDSSDIVTTGSFPTSGSANARFEIIQNGATSIDGGALEWQSGDQYLTRVKGKDLGAYDDNIVWQARDILITYGGLTSGDFDANWATYRDKSTPTASAISTFKSRIWQQDPQQALSFALSLLEEVRLEAFVDRTQKVKINSLHFEDFEDPATIDYTIKTWDLDRDNPFNIRINDRNNFNRAKGSYGFLPTTGEQARSTPIFQNAAAIADSKEISKNIVFPHLIDETVVQNQVKEILKMASGYIEHIDLTSTWRAMLVDIGDFVILNVSIQGTVFEDVPCMVRSVGVDPNGIKIPMTLWSFQMLPYPNHSPGYSGITGGSTATITQE